MADEVEVRVKAVDQGSQNIQKFGATLSGLATKALAVGIGMQGLKTAFGAVEGAARMAWQTMGEGAQLQLAQDRFENLAASIGTTADALTNELGAATQGMMSNAQLVASASDIISLGLGDTSEEVVRLGNLVGQLGWDMQVLTLTLANDSTMRLDSLGLSVENVTARMEELKASGMAAGDAFDLAVIEAGEKKLELLGSAADSSVGSIQKLTAMWANATDVFRMNFADGVVDQLNAVADAIGQNMPGFEEGMGELGRKAGAAFGDVLAEGAAIGVNSLNSQIEDQLHSIGVTRQELAELKRESTADLPIFGGGQLDLKYATDYNAALEDQYSIQLQLIRAMDARSEWDDWGSSQLGAVTELGQAYEYLIEQYERAAALSAAARDSQVGATTRARDAVRDLAASIVEEKAVWSISTDAVEAHAEAIIAAKAEGMAAANAIQEAYTEAAARASSAFSAALDDGMNFDNLAGMREMAFDMAEAWGLSVPQLGEIGTKLGVIDAETAEAAAKAALFQLAVEQLMKGFQIGAIDATEFTTSFDAIVKEMQEKSLVEIQLDLKMPERVPTGQNAISPYLPDFSSEPIEVPISVVPAPTTADNALSTALAQIDGIPDEQQKIIIFEADYDAVTTAAETTIPAAIQGISADARTVTFIPEAGEVHAEISALANIRLTIPVDFVTSEPPSPPGHAVGGAVSGGMPYIVGEAGPELFVPWTHGSIVPNHRIGGGGTQITVANYFYGPADADEVARATDTAGRRLLERLAQMGMPT